MATKQLTRPVTTKSANNRITMHDIDNNIKDLLYDMPPITLEQMAGIRLMNRLDTKYVASKAQLVQLLKLVQDDYYVQETLDRRIIPYLTTYYDTQNHFMYMMHHNGHARRMKVRVRTYVASHLTFLEVKNTILFFTPHASCRYSSLPQAVKIARHINTERTIDNNFFISSSE